MKIADALLIVLALLMVWSFYRAHKDPTVRLDLFDLVMSDGRLSRIAVAFMLTLGVTSWVVIRLALDSKLTEGYFTAYGAMWVAPIVAKLFSTPPGPGTTTEISATSTTTKVGP